MHRTRVILVVRDNPPVQNRVKLVIGNLTGQKRVKTEKILLLNKVKSSREKRQARIRG